jgi:uncharacterized protein YndB with AHSA1/START domain
MVYDHGGYDDRPPLFRVTVTFKEVKGKTKMDMSMGFATPEVAEEMQKFIKNANGYSTWDRLAEYLEKESSGKEQFVINRSFDAPLEVLFEMWTNPKHFAQWLPPTGATMEILKGEMKPGSSIFYCMKGAHGTMYGHVKYLEIEKPSRLVYTQQFADERGGVARHPMAPTWPETMLTTVRLEEEGADRTRVTVIWEPYGKSSREEIEAFVQARSGMTQGWTGSFDKLEAYIARPR